MATELAHAELELEEVKEALCEGKSYLGLSGSLLQKYAEGSQASLRFRHF